MLIIFGLDYLITIENKIGIFTRIWKFPLLPIYFVRPIKDKSIFK